MSLACTIHIKGSLFVPLSKQVFLLNFFGAEIQDFGSQHLGVCPPHSTGQQTRFLHLSRRRRVFSTVRRFCFTVHKDLVIAEVNTRWSAASVVHISLRPRSNTLLSSHSLKFVYSLTTQENSLALVTKLDSRSFCLTRSAAMFNGLHSGTLNAKAHGWGSNQ